MNTNHRPDAHNQWYGYNNNNGYNSGYNQQPPPGFPLRPPQRWAAPPPHAHGGRPRKCNLMWWIIGQLSLILPFILIFIVAYAYIQDARWRGSTLPAGSPALVQLYLTIPLAAASIAWYFAVMIARRRSAHRGRPIPQRAVFAVEMVLAAGAVVCFVLMVVTLHGGSVGRTWSEDYIPYSYYRSMAWLLGMLM